MNIDLISERAWTSVIDGTRDVQFEFLALQLFLINLRNRLQANTLNTQGCIRELKTFYKKFSRLPIAERDFKKIADREDTIASRLLDAKDVATRIAAGQCLMLAGEETLLATLPPGNWIGGTIPYFMTQDGGCLCKDKIFVTEIPPEFAASIQTYTASQLSRLYQDADEGSVTLVIIPADSPAHIEFGLHAPHYPEFALHPLVGWIAGTDLSMVGKSSPKVFCGGPQPLGDAAAIMRIKLPPDQLAQIKIVNLFQPGTGDTIRFSANGFSATTATINGGERNLAEYLQSINADLRLPLVANYCGAMVNVSLKTVDSPTGRVEFYAPVVSGIDYRLASPIGDYVAKFESSLKEFSPGNLFFSCNCILNYLHSQLQGRQTGAFVGPVTFGEIAFQLLNQTLVYIEVINVATPESKTSATALELSAAHEELQASERRFRTLSESAPLGIFLTDDAGRLIYSNSRCQDFTGIIGQDAAGGVAWMRSVHPNDLPALTAAIKACEQAGTDFDHEFRFIDATGNTRWLHSRTSVLRSQKGKLTGRIGTVEDITERKQSEIELERINQDLVRASREAGIAEVASGILHNVKNVINSLNVSAGVIANQLQQSKSGSLAKVNALIREHSADLGTFITEHPKGKLLPKFLEQLADQLANEREAIMGELRQFEKNVQHIKEVVTMQQGHAKMGGTSERLRPVELMEDSLRIVSSSLIRHGIQVAREYDEVLPDVTVEKHKVLQILVNFIRNANQACQSSHQPVRKVILRATSDADFVYLAVVDNGIGIPAENIKHIFTHGFTTKKDGHGFGLHSSTQVVKDLGGEVKVHSDGVGTGATFTVKLPLRPSNAK